jgi:hypothetical protein
LLASIIFAPPLSSGQKVFVFPSFIPNNFFLLFLFIFTFNLAISAFTVVTLPGLLFFPLSTVALV